MSFLCRAAEGKVNCPKGAREAGLGRVGPYRVLSRRSDTSAAIADTASTAQETKSRTKAS